MSCAVTHNAIGLWRCARTVRWIACSSSASSFSRVMRLLAIRAGGRTLRCALAGRRLSDRGLAWPEALLRMAQLPEVDAVMAAIVGAAGLPPTLAAAVAGKKILLANKEALVMAGPVFMRAVRESGATLLPIDSEHNAIFQSLPSTYSGDLAESGVLGLFLTASGGPFRNWPSATSSPSAPSRRAPIRTGSWDERYRSTARR
jgi:hypothetical protein